MSATAPTQPIPPRPFEPSVDASSSGAAGQAIAGPPVPSAAPAGPVPWYRRVWVLVVAALLIGVLSFGAGFVAGNAASLFDGLLGGPGRGVFDGGRDFPDGVPPGDGRFPGSPNDTTSSQG